MQQRIQASAALIERPRFPDERGGMVNVVLRQVGHGKLELLVEDNGKGCPEDAKEGLGSRIVRLLAQQLGGTITRLAVNPGCRVIENS
jgi:two-component sensor histidine kinase